MLKLNIGCGKEILENYINIDKDDYGQEIIRDITKGLPFSNNTCSEIRAYSVLEHLDSEDLLFIMRECHRVLKPGGIFDICVPLAGSDGSFRDPTHKTFFTASTFDYFCEGKPDHYEINPNHKFRKIKVTEKGKGAVYARLMPIK